MKKWFLDELLLGEKKGIRIYQIHTAFKDYKYEIISSYSLKKVKLIFDNNKYKYKHYEKKFKNNGNFAYKIKLKSKDKLINVICEKKEYKVKNYTYTINSFNKKSTLLFIDRYDMAYDNAYFLFLQMNKKFKNSYYVISKEAKDYKKIKKITKKILLLESSLFEQMYRTADWIFASQTTKNIENYKNYRRLKEGQKKYPNFVYLQHGSNMANVENWLIDKHINLILTATKKEEEEVKKFFFDDVIVAGMSRLDFYQKKEKKRVTIFLTWRKEFETLNSEELKNTYFFEKHIELLNSFSQKTYYSLHPNMLKHKQLYFQNIQSNICFEEKILNTIEKSKILITDYSSISYDVEFMKGKVIFYQFDKERFYNNQLYDYDKSYYENKIVCKTLKSVHSRLTDAKSNIHDNYETAKIIKKTIKKKLGKLI